VGGDARDEARALIAKLLGAKPAEMRSPGTRPTANIAAHAFDLKPGDNVCSPTWSSGEPLGVKHWERGRGAALRRSREGRLPA